jgi:CopG family nickel-responsive transcriptional regulator
MSDLTPAQPDPERLERFGVSMPALLLEQFDQLISRRGYSNRSEAIRDLVRESLVSAKWQEESGEAVGVVTLVYRHDVRETSDRLIELQHDHHAVIVASLHIHLSQDRCLEVIVVRGEREQVKRVADHLLAMRGVVHGRFVPTTTGEEIL